MRIQFHSYHFNALVEDRLGTDTQLQLAWAAMDPTGQSSELSPVTLRAWRKGTMPNRANLIRLARLLRVDPALLIDVNPSLVPRLMESLRLQMFGGTSQLTRDIRVFIEMLRPGPAWPPVAELGPDGPSGAWHCWDFLHDAQQVQGVFARLELDISQLGTLRTGCWYFAYRTTGLPQPVWRPYGVVRLFGDKAELFGSEGDYAYRQLEKRDRLLSVRTEFGKGAAAFRVASLSPFTGRIAALPCDDEALLTFP